MVAGPQITLALLSSHVSDTKETLVNEGSASINGLEQINLSSKIANDMMYPRSVSNVIVQI
jgi:hypothetical protein